MNLFEPVSYKRFYAKNSFVRAATKEELCSPGGHIPQEIFDLYEKIAQGGIGTIIVSSARAKLYSTTKPQGLFRLDRHDLLPEYKKLSDIGHSYGCTMIIQESFSKLKDINDYDELDFERAIRVQAEAAKFAEDCGFDGIELHEAHAPSMFMSQVLKPYFNKRTDEYGQNRGLFMEKVIEEIRKYVNDNFIIIVKTDGVDKGYGHTLEMSVEHCKRLEKSGADVIDVSGPTVTQGADDKYKYSYFRDEALEIARNVDIPVMLVGGNGNLETLEELSDEGISLFGLSRMSTREFDIVNRWQSGDRSDSKCLMCNSCLKTLGHLCPFNTENPFDFRGEPFYNAETGEYLKGKDGTE